MGFNTVAVLYNDFDFRKQPLLGEMIADSMRNWSWPNRSHLDLHFGCGMVVSQAHADHTQIVAVSRNAGKPIEDCNDLDYLALQRMAECMIRHGWTAKAPSKPKRDRRLVKVKP